MFDDVLTALRSTDAKLELAVVFGSVARGEARFDSDIDVATRYSRTLSAEEKIALIESLAIATNRPVDLIDLRVAGPVVAREALTKGKRIFGSDEVWAEQVSRTLIDYADFAPLLERTLRERQDAWIKA
jgi:predicted nucleotidyltransferase